MELGLHREYAAGLRSRGFPYSAAVVDTLADEVELLRKMLGDIGQIVNAALYRQEGEPIYTQDAIAAIRESALDDIEALLKGGEL